MVTEVSPCLTGKAGSQEYFLTSGVHISSVTDRCSHLGGVPAKFNHVEEFDFVKRSFGSANVSWQIETPGIQNLFFSRLHTNKHRKNYLSQGEHQPRRDGSGREQMSVPEGLGCMELTLHGEEISYSFGDCSPTKPLLCSRNCSDFSLFTLSECFQNSDREREEFILIESFQPFLVYLQTCLEVFGAKGATIENLKEFNIANNFVSKSVGDVFIGLAREPLEVDSPITTELFSFEEDTRKSREFFQVGNGDFPWSNGEPNTINNECVAIGQLDGRWRDISCNTVQQGLCRRPCSQYKEEEYMKDILFITIITISLFLLVTTLVLFSRIRALKEVESRLRDFHFCQV